MDTGVLRSKCVSMLALTANWQNAARLFALLYAAFFKRRNPHSASLRVHLNRSFGQDFDSVPLVMLSAPCSNFFRIPCLIFMEARQALFLAVIFVAVNSTALLAIATPSVSPGSCHCEFRRRLRLGAFS